MYVCYFFHREWYRGWWSCYKDQNQMDKNFFWINYEDLKLDLVGQVKRIASFINVECSDRYII